MLPLAYPLPRLASIILNYLNQVGPQLLLNVNAWPEAPLPPPPAIPKPLYFDQLVEGVDLDGPEQDRINILAQQYDAMLAQVEP